MSAKIEVQIVQASPASRDVESNTMKVMQTLKSSEADVVLFPELFLSGYQVHSLDEVSLESSDPVIERLQEACRRTATALVVGLVERGKEGRYFNSLLVIDWDGSRRELIRKTHLFGAEREAFSQGDVLGLVQLCERQWGILNCFELEFPEVARTLALKGAEGFLAVSANMSPYIEEHVIAVRARSMENRLPVAYANRVGAESGYEFCGRSMVVDHHGNVIKSMGETEEGSAVVSITFKPQVADAVDMLEQLRPELYKI